MARVAVVTGGTRGIGAAIARVLKERGVAVAATYVASEENAQRFRDETGITRDTTFHKMSGQQWDDVVRTNLGSCFAMTRAVIEGMRDRGFGRIISIGSVNGQRGQYGQVNYAAAKAGIIGFTKALALECAAKNITVNVVAPGYVDTEMVAAVPPDVLKKIIGTIPAGRLGSAEDVARAVLFLADDAQSFITGSTITVNGGQYMLG